MGVLPRMHDVFLLEAVDGEVALAHSHDEEFLLLAGDAHRVQGVGRFVSVGNTLEELVPDFERLVLTGGPEFTLVDICQASHMLLVSTLAPEIFLDTKSPLTHIRLHRILLLRSSTTTLTRYFDRFHSN